MRGTTGASVAILLAIVLAAGCASATGSGDQSPPKTDDVPGEAPAPADPEPATPDLSSPEALGLAVLDTLASGDLESFSSFALGTEEQYKDLIASLKIEEEEREEILAEMDRQHEKNLEEIVASWKEVREEATRDGVDWAHVAFESAKVLEEQRDKWDAMGWVERTCQVLFTSRGRRFTVELEDCLQMGDAWRVHDEMNWLGIAE